MQVISMKPKSSLRVGCVVMAAGNAERFGENKLAAVVDGKTMVERALDAVPEEKLSAVCAKAGVEPPTHYE